MPSVLEPETDTMKAQPIKKDTLKHLEIAKSYLGTCEPNGNNRGPEINKFLAFDGLDPGYQWCAAFTSWCNHKAGVEEPDLKDARSRMWITDNSFKLSRAQREGRPIRGMIGVHRHTRFTGHVSYIIGRRDGGRKLRTIAGNEGNCVAYRTYTARGRGFDAPKILTPVSYD
jgi:hypothetical protein